MSRHLLHESKKGAAAFYVVIFTTLLLSVITMSFIRIMLSEATKTTNDDLSKSAYDSALAGVEDAKIALVKYHQCLDKGYSADGGSQSADINSCEYLIWAMRQGGCDTVALALGRNGRDGKEVIVREGKTVGTSSKNSIDMEQAYTCVKLSEDLPDYRAQLGSTNRVHIIPIRAKNPQNITGIRFQWFTPSKHPSTTNTSDKFVSRSELESGRYIPPVTLDIFQTDPNFSLAQLSLNSTEGTDHSSLLLQPSANPNDTRIFRDRVLSLSDKADNNSVRVYCKNNTDFRCSIDVEFPKTFGGNDRNGRNQTTNLLRVELPYGEPDADFSVELCTGTGNNLCDTTENFVGVQAQIDSTGRANDLFRRVDARVELIDTNFPYPEFAIQLQGDSNENINKNFWVTNNCWSSGSDGEARPCNDSGKVN